jgi:hypothetical protein
MLIITGTLHGMDSMAAQPHVCTIQNTYSKDQNRANSNLKNNSLCFCSGLSIPFDMIESETDLSKACVVFLNAGFRNAFKTL